jgi:predicted transcriptional regulator
MARTPQDVTDAELAVLQVLWDLGSASRRQLADTLYPGGSQSHYTTVQKLLERLEAKGYVVPSGRPGAWSFTAAVNREQLINRRLRALADKLCEGSLTPLLTNLLRASEFSAQELHDLRGLIDELNQQSRPKAKRR